MRFCLTLLLAKQYPANENPACISTATDKNGVSSGCLSEASRSANTQVVPNNGSAITETQRSVLKKAKIKLFNNTY